MKVAHYCALAEQYEKAIEIYDQVSFDYLVHIVLGLGSPYKGLKFL